MKTWAGGGGWAMASPPGRDIQIFGAAGNRVE